MASRFYFPSSGSSSVVSPARGATPWPAGGSVSRSGMPLDPVDSSHTGRTITEAVAGPAYGSQVYQFVSEPLPGGIWLSSFRIVAQVTSSTTGNTVSLAARVALVDNAGTTVRAELYAGRSASTTGIALIAQEIAAAVAQTATNPGDRLVVELGLYNDNAVSTTAGGTLRVGDRTDLADLAVGQTADGRGFFEGTFAGPPYNVSAAPLESASSGVTRRVGAGLSETLYDGDERRIGAATIETLYEGDLRIMGALLTEVLVIPRKPLLTASGDQVYIRHPDGRWEAAWLRE